MAAQIKNLRSSNCFSGPFTQKLKLSSVMSQKLEFNENSNGSEEEEKEHGTSRRQKLHVNFAYS